MVRLKVKEALLKRFVFTALLICGWLILPPAGAQIPIGLDAVEQIEYLPLYRRAVISKQISSYDPTGGDNDDIGFLYNEGLQYIIFDQEGPGCIYRIWIREGIHTADRYINFYFNGEQFPRISAPISQLFSGLQSPFLSPLVGNPNVSSGGYYCYFPIAFANHLKIVLQGSPEGFQIQYQVFPPGTEVATYTGQEDPSAVISQWQNTGSDPKSPAGNISESGFLSVNPQETQTFFSRAGSGSITGVILTPSPNTLSVLQNLILRFTWDDAEIPQVECSFGSFFGTSLGPAQIAGLPLGTNGTDYYCYLPMPFWDNARLDIYNASQTAPVDIAYEVTYKTDAYPDSSGYLTVVQQSFTPSDPSLDLLLGSLSGHGNLVGFSLSLISSSSFSQILHGDLRGYMDGIAFPILLGTDYDGDFNAGNYYVTGPFTLPVHGTPVITSGYDNQITSYRFLLGDMIPFGNSLTLYAEHGHGNRYDVEYSSVLYAYSKPEIELILTDELDVGDPQSEADHNYGVSGGQLSLDNFYTYPGTFNEQYFRDEGRKIFDEIHFTASVDPENQGVRIVKRRDASVFPQGAVVAVNGDSVGIWWDSDANSYQRWSDSIFEIPASFTAGYAEIEISITFERGDGWTEYDYQVYSHIPPRPDLDPPSQVTGVVASAVESGAMMDLSWDPAEDDNGIARYRIYRSTDPGFEPAEEYLIRELPLRTFTDYGLTPGTYYYYRVSAVDYSGNEGEASEVIEARTSANYLFEAEWFSNFPQTSGDGILVQFMIEYGDNWSNQRQMLYASDQTDDFFTTALDIAFSDSFDVGAYYTRGPTYGIVTLSVDGQMLGGGYDLFSPVVSRTSKIEYGTIYLEAGTHLFTFQVMGKNLSSLSYNIGVDDLLLTSHYLLPVLPEESSSAPRSFVLYPAYPNPFNAVTQIRYQVPRPGNLQLTVYDLLGRKVTTLVDRWSPPGIYRVAWEAGEAASGIYIVRLVQDDQQANRKLLLLK